MSSHPIPSLVPNIIDGKHISAAADESFEKFSPHTGKLLFHAARSRQADVQIAIATAKKSQISWAATPAAQRGFILHQICNHLERHADEIARTVALETGKSLKDAKGETAGAIALGRFYAGEGQRLYGRTTTSGTPDKYAMTVRQPCGVVGLIVAANTPIANIAWKVFPALICGNAAILKPPEDAPATGWLFTTLLEEAGLPKGTLNLVQGLGAEAGAAIVESSDVDVISFTGSTKVGRWIAETAGKRLAKVSLELGGKNPLVVCDDAHMPEAVKWVCLSAFSNAGQRCAAASRIIIFESVYDAFVKQLLQAAKALKVGPMDEDDFGPVINLRQAQNILSAIETAKKEGARILCGGEKLPGDGYYIAPTIIEATKENDALAEMEVFGPVTVLYKAKDFHHALAMANHSPYGLTACIHTQNAHRAQHFVQHVRSGVAVVNAGTYGSEPHMPFGGIKQSGNGSREPGTEALDIYSELKDIYYTVNRNLL